MIKKLTFLSVMLIFLSSNYTYISANKVSTNQASQKFLPTILKKFKQAKVPEISKSDIAALVWLTAFCVVIYIAVKQHNKTNRVIKEGEVLITEGNSAMSEVHTNLVDYAEENGLE